MLEPMSLLPDGPMGSPEHQARLLELTISFLFFFHYKFHLFQPFCLIGGIQKLGWHWKFLNLTGSIHIKPILARIS